MARIDLQDVSLTFTVRQMRALTLKEFLVGRMFRGERNPVLEVPALRDLTMSVGKGERIGIIGHNGAGKSTLLKLLAGIYTPTKGQRTVVGKISSLFDINLGFEAEASGWENIAYRSYLQGETPRDVQRKRAAIAEFSDLGDKFLQMPVKYYSAGMQVRLAFSIATAVDPEVLLIDEVLGVGDMAFQKKARKRMREMMDKAQLMVLVSHDLESIREMCTRAAWLDHGRLMRLGPVEEVIGAYHSSVANAPAPAQVGAA
jgi:ABC-type polysaccharide/polyol phosphate transport system ATPase subunit